MRAFRRFAVGAGLILLLALNGASVGAFHSESAEVIHASETAQASGTVDFDEWPLPGSMDVEGLTDLDGGSIIGHVDGTDPRITGTWEITWEYNGQSGAGLGPVTGSARLETTDGAWVGTWGGTMFRDGFCSRGWLTGEGAYEGLTYFMQGVTQDGHAQTEGIIYESN